MGNFLEGKLLRFLLSLKRKEFYLYNDTIKKY